MGQPRAATAAGRVRALESEVRRLERRLRRLSRMSYRYSWARLGAFVAGLLAVGLALYLWGPWLAGLVAALAALLFGLTVYLHLLVERSIARHRIWLALKSSQVARSRLDWERIPAVAAEPPDLDHPFAADLDLVGPRSLLRLLSTAVSAEGCQRLRDWLIESVPSIEVTLRRQELVRELVPLSRFRDRLALSGALVGENPGWRAGDLVAWLERRPSDAHLGRWLSALGALAALDAGLFVANQLGWLPALWQISFLAYAGLTLALNGAVRTIWDEALRLQGALWQLRVVFRHLERFSYRGAPRLRVLCAPFLDPALRPSSQLDRLSRVLSGLGLRANPLVDLALNAVLPWNVLFAYLLEQRRGEIAKRLPTWMDVWFELEALGSLATAAHLNPEHAFPEVVAADATAGGFVFRAEGLGHPLIPSERRVCNDVAFGRLGEVKVISGSNMAGKSVFLKTVAVNLLLAQAGGAVCARSLATVPFRVFTCLSVSDSVTDGFSFFFAEVCRLRALLSELERVDAPPLLYCVDELFRGTNNRERLIGGRAYLRALAGRRGVGLVATHDLELAGLADEIAEVANWHFRDGVVGDRMVFDYTLRPGPCPTTNALRIMRSQGLPVPELPDLDEAESAR